MMRQLKFRQRRQGFTLIEILLAVMIFALVLVAINGVFFGAMRLEKKTSDLVAEGLPLQQTLAIIKRDLQGIMMPGGPLAGSLKSVVSSGGMEPGQSSPEIYTSSGAIQEALPWSNVQKVAYYLRQPLDRMSPGKDLVRLVTRNLLATNQEQPTEQWLMGNVEQIQFSFHDGTQWLDTWDSTTVESVLPKALRVQLLLAATNKNQQAKIPVQLVVPVMVEVRTNLTQNAGGQQ